MPEGHSVHRLARQFNDVFGGERVAASSPQGRFAAGAALLDGQVMEHAQAHGKQLFLHFSGGHVLRVHLGLYGAWDFGGDATFTGASSIGAPRRVGEREEADDGAAVVYSGPPAPVGAVRVRLVSEHGWADLRGPTACQVITPAEAAALQAGLGPDPLHRRPGDEARFIRSVAASGVRIGQLLRNQDVIAGVGNVYRAEVLFRCGLNPLTPGKSLPEARIAAVWRDVVAVMADGVRDGRIITTELADRPSGAGVAPGQAMQGAGVLGEAVQWEDMPWEDMPGEAAPGGAERQEADGGSRGAPSTIRPSTIRPSTINRDVPAEEALYVYKRQGLPCRRCGTTVAMAELGGRKLYWCPECQR